MIRFACPGCGATYTVPDEKGGKTGKCPKCQGQFIIPEAEAGSAPAPPPRSGANDTAPVEIEPCPGCQARLSVAKSDVGLDVECPYCKTTYTAKTASPGASSSPSPSQGGGLKKSRAGSLSEALGGAGGGSSSRRERRSEPEDDDAPPPPRRRRDEDDDFEERPSRRSRGSRSRSGMVEISRVGVLSAAKITAVMYAIIGLIYGVLYGGMIIIFSLLGAGLAGDAGGGFLVGIGGGLCAIVMLPVMFGISGFIAGAIGAFIYNIAASKAGGLELELN